MTNHTNRFRRERRPAIRSGTIGRWDMRNKRLARLRWQARMVQSLLGMVIVR